MGRPERREVGRRASAQCDNGILPIFPAMLANVGTIVELDSFRDVAFALSLGDEFVRWVPGRWLDN